MDIHLGTSQVSISFWFALTLCIIMITDTEGIAHEAFLSAMAHELGHLAALKLHRQSPKQISFTPFGLRLKNHPTSKLSYRHELEAAFAGPLVNLLICTVLSILGLSKSSVFYINAALFFFNMLPVSELDGGRILYALLALLKNPQTAAAGLTASSILCIFSVFALFFIGALNGKYNYSLFLAVFYLGVLTLFSSGLLERQRE